MAKQSFDVLETKFISWVNARALHDPRYAEVLEVYDWAKLHHTGLRDNGDPEFIHPLRLALKVAGFIDKLEKTKGSYMPDAIDVLKAAICHDMLEDKRHDVVSGAVMDRHFLGRKIGARAGEIVFNVSRKYIDDDGNFVNKSKPMDHSHIVGDPAALMLKHLDRNDNLETMVDFKGGKAVNVIYTPEKARDKMLEAIQFLMQASLPTRVDVNYGSQWRAPMQLASTDLLKTIKKVSCGILCNFIDSKIFHETEYPVSNLLGILEFPQQSVIRLSKVGQPDGDGPTKAFPVVKVVNAPGTIGTQRKPPGAERQMG